MTDRFKPVSVGAVLVWLIVLLTVLAFLGVIVFFLWIGGLL